MRRAVDIIGRVLIGLGVVVLLFTAYQIWGTSIQEAHTQNALRKTLVQETHNDQIRKALTGRESFERRRAGLTPETPVKSIKE